MPRNKINQESHTYQLSISGLVQGVGFRPFIYRLAKSLNLTGEVSNQNKGVLINVNGEPPRIDHFIDSIKKNAPQAAIVENITKQITTAQNFSQFSICESTTVDNSITSVSPDIAVCEECLEDMKKQPNRIDYPFTNCTNCGPRYSIIEEIPYDRKQTSMKEFAMCPDCQEEYTNIDDRRFHAQPVACNNCGPIYTLHTSQGSVTDMFKVLEQISSELYYGKVVAIKGLGGYHLACDPKNEAAINKLREVKARDSKPFAIMAKDIKAVKKITLITEKEELVLSSWQRPIALVQARNPKYFPKDVACNLNTLGLFLPYMPFHHQLFEHTNYDYLIMTSANLSECPIITEDDEAVQTFIPQDVSVLSHNRKIVNRTDDSIVVNIDSSTQIIRRSRGYVPLPINLQLNTEGVLATGAELSGAFCLGKKKQGIMSPYIGDIKNFETMQFFEEAYLRLTKLFRFKPKVIACDLHPDYQSTQFADRIGLPTYKIQHHHAHIASCMAEFGLDEKVIGISYDGTGYGTDGKTWGSEIMLADLCDFERKYHFEYMPIPGGDKVSKEPWRSGISYLRAAFPEEDINAFLPLFARDLNSSQNDKIEMTLEALDKNINSPESCSAGRLFDAVASITGICVNSTYHAEAPILLENNIKENISETYPIQLEIAIDWKPVIQNIVTDIQNNISAQKISAKFHNTLAVITHQAVIKLNKETGINKVVLSGGTFQNKYLTKKIVDLVVESGLQPFISSQIPCNDGGIALGQLAIAAKKIRSCV